MLLRFTRRRKHVIVHADHHGYENNRIVEQVQFDPREEKLEHAEGHRLSCQIVVQRGLPEQEQMLNVMPELNHQRDGPPGPRTSREAFAKDPQPNQHHNRIPVMQSFRFDEPRIPESENAIGHWPRPPHDPDLVSLRQMFSPMQKNNGHENLQRPLMPARVKLFVNAWTC